MSKRGDYIHKRKDGRWEGRYPQGRNAKGTIKYASVYGKSYRDVKEKLSEISKTTANENALKNHEKTFGQILQLWMENNKLRLKGGTINKYQNLIDSHILPELGSALISELDATNINKFLNKMLVSGKINGVGGLSPSYVRSMAIVINAAIKFAVDEGLCSPLKSSICKPVSEKKEFPVLDKKTQQQFETFLLKNLDLTKAGIFISLHTGMRIGEVCALSWEDIDLNQNVIHIRHTIARVRKSSFSSDSTTKLIIDSPKTKSSLRDIPISSKLLPVILEIRQISSAGFVISENNSFVHPRTYETRYHKTLKECNIEKINYHALRHTFATRCIEAGVDVKSLSEILGHGNVSVTLNTYVHSSMEMKRNQLEKLYKFSA